ncbi:ABC-2 type transporter [Ostreococcus tauri]|uniref:ABC-2 type transporter n=1 Tax=Ostreococcus tauri TaxID=70448 RepID=A0A090LZL4_OSTTA|nr:ABC-2 type transporter [Ostreococcus tauri]CEF97435.1 ABC-2 type transporter [Ostreococcus tauri]|eukprot:XP_003078590.2 ABC-2 type transporter [Ostreococcus tauri]
MDLVLGVALWASPPCVKFPGLVVAALARRRLGAARRRRDGRAASSAATSADDGVGVDLTWREVSMTVRNGRTGMTRRVLDACSGSARAGRLVAVMGPSGAGKSSLLNALAGQVPESARVMLTGVLRANGADAGDGSGFRKAYVQQEDALYSMLTVRETLETAAKLGGSKDVKRTTETLLNDLGLAACADTRVGDAKTRGVSGGEKKRLALGVQLVGAPSVIFADEPTSGLDSFQAEKVMKTLSKLAKEHGKTVVCSIHQPRSSIVDLFDDLYLLADGRCAYFGPMSSARDWFEKSADVTIPNDVNVAEYLIDIVSIDATSAETTAETSKRIDRIVKAMASNPPALAEDDVSKGLSTASDALALTGKRVGFWGQFPLLLKRSWRQVTRDKATNKVRLLTSLNSAMVFGSIFWKMKLTQTAIQDRMGLLQVSAINAAMSALMKTLTSFTKEKVIVNRERASKAYGVLPYFTSKLVAELPVGAFFPLAFGACVYPMAGLHPTLGHFARFCTILTVESFSSSALGLAISSIAPSTEAAVAMGPAVMVLFIVFGGYYVNQDNVPIYFKWLNKCSLIKWAFQGLCVNEFQGLKFETKRPFDQKTGEDVLERLSFQDATPLSSLRQQGNILSFLYLLTLYLLDTNAPKFAVMQPPSV